MLSLEFSSRTGHGRFGLSNCFKAVGFENYVAASASAPEERDSLEDTRGVPFTARTLGYGKEVNWAGLEAWRCLQNDGVVPVVGTLEDLRRLLRRCYCGSDGWLHRAGCVWKLARKPRQLH